MKINTHGGITSPIIEGDFVAVGGLRRLREELRQFLDSKHVPVTFDGEANTHRVGVVPNYWSKTNWASLMQVRCSATAKLVGLVQHVRAVVK